MTFGVRNVLSVLKYHSTKKSVLGLFFTGEQWTSLHRGLYDFVIGAHVNMHLCFLAAFLCYWLTWPYTFPYAAQFEWKWISIVVAFNLACEFICYGFWHWFVYQSKFAQGPLKEKKFNPVNQYENSQNLRREIFFTTLGWLHSSAYQVVMMHLWATGKVPYYTQFWQYPAWSLFWLLFMSYWRHFHFYWVHRFMHPWFDRKYGLRQGDIGAFLYRYFHSLHHKSYNTGPWSGLSMHPVEHFFYYTCTLIVLFFNSHPLHFLYAKFHCDISPIGGHDGYGDPGCGDDYHYMHHAKFECNYGTPVFSFDKLFGTYQDGKEYLESIKAQSKKAQ
jgi:sterol desaturase/sphingolipid hydroxylase (fatty acid hydroxylase superfamily)